MFVISIACAVRIFNCFGFALQGLFANEVYPTAVRTLGTGFLYSIVFLIIKSTILFEGIFGSFLSPYIIKLSDIEGLNPYLMIGIFTLAGPIGTIMVRETLN